MKYLSDWLGLSCAIILIDWFFKSPKADTLTRVYWMGVMALGIWFIEWTGDHLWN